MSTTYTAVLPAIVPDWRQRCLRSMLHPIRTHVLVVNNEPPNENIGVSASWNLGIDQMLRDDTDWLIIISESIRFGQAGGSDFLEQLDLHSHPSSQPVAIEGGHGIGWHLIAFPRYVIEKVGRFDENFFAYYEDNDYARRISLAFGLNPLYSSYASGAWCTAEPAWVKTTNLDVASAGNAHAVDMAGVHIDNKALHKYYAAKWGAMPGGHEGFIHPFDDDAHGIDWWPTPPDPRSTMAA